MPRRRAALAALLLALLPRRGASEPVCQVLTESNTTLEDLLGIRCNTTNSSGSGPVVCDCNTGVRFGNRTWAPMTTMNSSFDYVDEGKWVLASSDGQCVALGESPRRGLVLPCPPGFYCSGRRAPPRSCGKGEYCPGNTGNATPAGAGPRCPAGHFCPAPAGPLCPGDGPCPAGIFCGKGSLCPEGSTWPQACDPGFFCPPGIGHQVPCPSGSWCGFGTESPVRCGVLSRCPEGSTAEVKIADLLLVAAAFGGFSMGARYYDALAQRGLWAFAACLVPVLFLWLLGVFIGDIAVAGWLSLNLFIVSLNWALLQLDTYRPMGPRALLCVSMGATMWALWTVNPPWAVLIGGLLLFAGMFWLMSRQEESVVVLGRVLLLLAFLGLCVAYWLVDRKFFTVVACFGLSVVILSFVSWQMERRRQRHLREFATRWPVRQEGDCTPAQTSAVAASWTAAAPWTPLGEQGMAVTPPEPATGGPPPPASWGARVLAGLAKGGELQSGAPEQADAADRLAVASSSSGSQRSRATGVNFWLDDVSFFLPDGTKLLKGVSMRIGSARQVAVMGPSGGGKSTLLAVLSGRASYGQVSGRLLVSGRKADDLRFLKDVVGFVPQDDILHGELTVEENIRYQASLRMPAGTTYVQLAAKTAQVMEDLSLSKISGARVGTPECRGVSGGQRKRVSIAMELVTGPCLLFADEPTSGLDSFTSHEVVGSLTKVARSQSTTSVAVIHQPRWETLELFDDLVLLGAGGCLVYAGTTRDVVEHFRSRLQVEFPPNMNPADRLLDSIQRDPDACADVWRDYSQTLEAPEEEPAPPSLFHRQRPAFFQGVLIFMDRSMLQSVRAGRTILINQVLCVGMVTVLCSTIEYQYFDRFMMQAAFAALFLMLLHCIAAQRVFGPDLLVTSREARVGGPMVAYLVAKDLAALFEITLSAIVFTAAYGILSGVHFSLARLFSGSWAFLYSVSGMSYIYSITMSPGSAQMCGVGSSVIAFCMAGSFNPLLPDLVGMLGGRGWMLPALSPVRWLYGFLLTAEAGHLTEFSRSVYEDHLRQAGYDLSHLDMCQANRLGRKETDHTLKQDWLEGRGWVCSAAPMLLLGIIFRFLAGLCLLLYVGGQTSGWARFLAQSNAGAWKLLGRLFALLVFTFLALFFFAEIWVFGLLSFNPQKPLRDSLPPGAGAALEGLPAAAWSLFA